MSIKAVRRFSLRNAARASLLLLGSLLIAVSAEKFHPKCIDDLKKEFDIYRSSQMCAENIVSVSHKYGTIGAFSDDCMDDGPNHNDDGDVMCSLCDDEFGIKFFLSAGTSCSAGEIKYLTKALEKALHHNGQCGYKQNPRTVVHLCKKLGLKILKSLPVYSKPYPTAVPYEAPTPYGSSTPSPYGSSAPSPYESSTPSPYVSSAPSPYGSSTSAPYTKPSPYSTETYMPHEYPSPTPTMSMPPHAKYEDPKPYAEDPKPYSTETYKPYDTPTPSPTPSTVPYAKYEEPKPTPYDPYRSLTYASVAPEPYMTPTPSASASMAYAPYGSSYSAPYASPTPSMTASAYPSPSMSPYETLAPSPYSKTKNEKNNRKNRKDKCRRKRRHCLYKESEYLCCRKFCKCRGGNWRRIKKCSHRCRRFKENEKIAEKKHRKNLFY